MKLFAQLPLESNGNVFGMRPLSRNIYDFGDL